MTGDILREVAEHHGAHNAPAAAGD
jgi:hypothetical protein